MNEPRRRRPRCYNLDDVKDRIRAVFAPSGKTRSGSATSSSGAGTGAGTGKLSGYALFGPAIRLLFAAVGCILVLLILPPAIKSAPAERIDSELRNFDDPFGLEPEFHGTVAVVYSAKDGWGADAAGYLAEQLETQKNLSSVCVTDTDYSEDPGDHDLVVSLGCTELNSDSYLGSYIFLGKNGYEITDLPPENADHVLSVTAFSSSGAMEAAELILNSISAKAKTGSAGRIYAYDLNISEDVYVTRKDSSSGAAETDGLILLEVKDKDAPVFVISYPDAEPATLNALDLALQEADPALVVFNGGLSCGARDRNSLYESWSSVCAVLSAHGTPWCFTLSDKEDLPHETIADILPDLPGCLNGSCRNGSVGSLLVLTYESEIYTAMLIADTVDLDSERSGAFFSRINSQFGLLRRAESENTSLCAVLPGVLPTLAALMSDATSVSGEYDVNSDLFRYMLPAGTDLLDTCMELGINTFFSFSGTADSGYASYSHPSGTTVNTFFCGSIGFSYPGIGGKFELNNSLRGGILADLYKLRSGNAPLCVRRITASEIGANKKSEG